ncbi:MAG: quaternary ammonium compound efflux SMR transporter SugE [Phototrophicaceae bacterium]
MPWIILSIAGLFEVFWALMLKQSEGFTKLGPTILFLVGLFLSMVLLAQALKSLPVGTAYAVWTGIGAIGTAIFGMVWLGESRDILKLFSILLIVIGIMGLRLATAQT